MRRVTAALAITTLLGVLLAVSPTAFAEAEETSGSLATDDAAAACLGRTSVEVVDGPVASGRLGPGVNWPDGTGFDARGVTWKKNAAASILFGVGEEDICVVGGYVSGHRSHATSTWSEHWHHDWGVVARGPGFEAVGTVIDNVGDAFVAGGQGGADFSLRGVRVIRAHDDCVQNDASFSGSIDDSFFDGCYTFYSSRGGANTDGTNETVTITNSLVRMEAMPSAAKGLTNTHGPIWKLSSNLQANGISPQLELHGNTFWVDHVPSEPTLKIPRPPLDQVAPHSYIDGSDDEKCSGNTIVWGGDPNDVPADLEWYVDPSNPYGLNHCFTLKTVDDGDPSGQEDPDDCETDSDDGEKLWCDEVERWLEAHSDGTLAVTTQPSLPAVITVDDIPRSSWSTTLTDTWLAEDETEHEVCFGDVPGYKAPPCEVVDVRDGQTTTVVGQYTQRGTLRVITSPAVASTISVDGVARNDWGVWTDVDPGTYEVCFGAVEGFDAPACQQAVVTAGSTTTITGSFTTNSSATGPPAGYGYLRVTTDPAVASRIVVDDEWRDSWGLTWLKLAPGSYEVCFEDVIGATTPDCETANISSGNTTVVEGDFVLNGTLHLETDPTVAGISIESDQPGAVREQVGHGEVYVSRPPGTYEVCFGSILYWLPAVCDDVVVTAGNTTPLTGIYTLIHPT